MAGRTVLPTAARDHTGDSHSSTGSKPPKSRSGSSVTSACAK